MTLRGNPVTVVGFHHSGRWDRTPESFGASIARMRTGRSFGTRTEVGGLARQAELKRDDGWETYRPLTPFGLTDCSVEWRADVWEALDGYTVQLTQRRIFTRDGFHLPPTTLVAAVLRHRASGKVLVLGTTHRNLRNTALRRAARWSEARGARAHLCKVRAEHPGWHIAIQYDENSNQRLRLNRRQVWATILRGTDMRNLWGHHGRDAARQLGTHGSSLLDVTLSTDPGKTTTLPGDPSSDHRPYETTLRLGAEW